LNRIVIIGNGFDLAHGFHTKYSDFFEYLKNDIFETGIKTEDRDELIIRKKNEKSDPLIALRYNKDKIVPINNDGIQYIGSYDVRKYDFIVPKQNKTSILYASLFELKTMNENWSDLESHYFKIISKHKSNSQAIAIINFEFDHLKKLLEEYLFNKIEKKVEKQTFELNDRMIQLLKGNYNEFTFQDTYVVSFNYTNILLKKYLKKSSFFLYPIDPIHIHGKLANESNPIIFGYGDDNSEEYENIKNQFNNELLHNFKTFQYLRLSQYEQVLGLLETDEEIYVQIIGHSCGIGDKTLLRTIFQHKNVSKIESHYHDSQKYYFENLYNISRIFDETELMRNKILPLKKTTILPSIKPIMFEAISTKKE
jgi:hypothetical protein